MVCSHQGNNICLEFIGDDDDNDPKANETDVCNFICSMLFWTKTSFQHQM